MRALLLAPLLLGLAMTGGPAYAGKDVYVTNVSPNKAARALQRAHLKDGVRKFVLNRLLGEIGGAPVGGGSFLRVRRHRWGQGVWYAPRTVGSKAIEIIIPRLLGGKSGVIITQGEILGDGVLIGSPREAFLVDHRGRAQPASNDQAWGWK